MTNALERLVEQLRRLPGIGSKSARRLAYHLVEMPKEEVDRLVETIVEAKGATRHCSICFNLSAQDPCEFCSNPNRDQTTIMVVETSRDVIAIERSGDYKGAGSTIPFGRQSCLAASPSNTFCYRTMSYGGNTASTSCAVNPRLLPPGKRMRETCASAVAIPGN